MDQAPVAVAPDELIKAKAFTLTQGDVAIIEAVRHEENLRTASSALRLLIREGSKYRDLKRQAEREVIARISARGRE